jgi:predicted ATPase
MVLALVIAAMVHQFRREDQAVQERAEAMIALCTEQGLPFFLALGTTFRGYARAEQGQTEEGIEQIRQGLAAAGATGVEVERWCWLVLLAQAYGRADQAEEGLSVVAEALAGVDKTGERCNEAELYRLKGQLTLQKFQVSSHQPQPLTSNPHAEAEAEACFHTAIEIARKQEAKSLELRAVMSLSRLWQQQGKMAEAHQLLSEIYTWFTEGFDTKDLQEAKALLDELAVSLA